MRVISASDVPASTSPVSQGKSGGGFVFVGGQMPRDIQSGIIVDGAEAQAFLSLEYCMRILRESGAGPEHVMLAFVYLTELSAKEAVNKAFTAYFPTNPPARNLVEVSKIGDGAIVEIGVIALAP